jgi:hypothetical protein
MNLFIKIIFPLVIFFISDIYSQDCEARLTIECDIENVNLFIDDTLAGESMKIEVSLTKGFHRIVVLENSDRWDAKTFIDSLYVDDCDDILLQYYFKNSVLLNTDPEDVYVFSNDSLVGYTPLLVPMNLKNIRLEKNGYESIDVNYSNFGTKKPIKMNFIGEYDDERFFDKTFFKILAGSMVLLGATTAYFKIEADDKFEEYQITGDQALLDQTNRFDTISAITFTALQINFGVIIYLFLVD